MSTNVEAESSQEDLFSKRAESSSTTDADYVNAVSELTPARVEALKTRKSSVLGIRCRRSDCKNSDLHCFDSTIRKPRFATGLCQDCGEDLIDWSILHSRSTDNIETKFDYLTKEWIRHFFFNVPITERIEEYAQKNGFAGLTDILGSHFDRKKMQEFDPTWDRRQTPMLKGTIVDWARHATGGCCRRCLSYWHGMPLQGKLRGDDIEYLTALAMRYIVRRLPTVAEPASLTQGA